MPSAAFGFSLAFGLRPALLLGAVLVGELWRDMQSSLDAITPADAAGFPRH